jgi:hypothetical protein
MLSFILTAAITPCIAIDTMPPQLRLMMIDAAQIFPLNVPGNSFVWHFAGDVYFTVNISDRGCVIATITTPPKYANELVRFLGNGI